MTPTAPFTLSRSVILSGLTALTLLFSSLPAWAVDGFIRNIRYDAASHHFLIEASGPVKAMVNTLKIADHKRIIIDVDNAEIAMNLPRDAQLLEALSRQMPLVRNVTVNQYGGNGHPIVRILMDLQGDPGMIRMIRAQGPQIELELNSYTAYQVPGRTPPATQTSGVPTPAGQVSERPGRPSPRSASYPTLEGPPSLATLNPPISPKPSTSSLEGPPSLATLKSGNSPKSSTSSLEGPPSLAALKSPMPSKSSAAPAGTPGVPEMKRTLVEMNRKYSALAEENQALRARLAEQINSPGVISPGTPGMEAMKRTLVEMNRRYDRLSEENRALQTRLSAAQPRPGSASPDADRLRAENHRLQDQLEQLRAARTGAASQSAATLAESERLRTENRRLQDQLEQLHAARTGESTQSAATLAESERLRTENRRLQSQLEQLHAARTGESTQSAVTLAESERLRTENRRLQSQLEQLRTARTGESTQSAVTLAESERLRTENRRLQSQLEQLRTAGANRNASIAASPEDPNGNSSAATVQTLRKQVTIAQQSLNEAIRTINEQNKEIAYLRNQVADVKAGLNISAREQIEQLQNTIAEKDAALQRVSAGKPASSSAGSVGTPEADGLKRQLATLTRQYQTDMQSLNQQLQTKNTELSALRNQTSQKTSQDQDSRLSVLRKERDQARQDLAIVRAELDKRARAAKKNAPVDTAMNADKAAAKAEAEKLTRENAELRNTVEELKAAQASASSAAAAADSPAFRQLREQLASLRLEQSSLNQELRNARQELAQYRKAHPEHPTASPSPSASIKPDATAQKRLSELERQMASLKQENQTLRNRNATLAESATTSNMTMAQAKTPKASASVEEAEQDYREGKAALSSGNFSKAIEQLKEAHLLNGDRPQYAIDYSAALAEDRQYAQAIDVLRRYLQGHPNERDVYNQLGKVYLLNEQPESANQAFTRAISTSMLNNYATSLKKLDKLPEAENVFKLAIGLNPNDSEVLFNLGNLYNAQNKLELARNQYLEAIRIRPDFAEAHYNLGLIFSKLGDNTKAVTHLEKFLQLSPNARNAETIRAYVQKLKV